MGATVVYPAYSLVERAVSVLCHHTRKELFANQRRGRCTTGHFHWQNQSLTLEPWLRSGTV